MGLVVLEGDGDVALHSVSCEEGMSESIDVGDVLDVDVGICTGVTVLNRG